MAMRMTMIDGKAATSHEVVGWIYQVLSSYFGFEFRSSLTLWHICFLENLGC